MSFSRGQKKVDDAFEIDAGSSDAEHVEIPIDRSGTLELDTRPLDGATLRSWRRETTDGTCPVANAGSQTSYLSMRQAASSFGVTASMWHNWENEKVSLTPYWRALLREWFWEDITIERGPVAAGYIRDVAALTGGVPSLADELETPASTLRDWLYDFGRTPKTGGSGALIRWLADELYLSPLGKGELRMEVAHSKGLTRTEVRGIRRLYDEDLSATEIRQRLDLDCSNKTIRRAGRGDTYQEVSS